MNLKSALDAAKANENPADARSPLRVALDHLGYAIGAADMAIGDLGDRLVPALEPESETGKGSARPAYSAPLVEEVHQMVDRVQSLTDRVRDLSDRVVL